MEALGAMAKLGSGAHPWSSGIRYTAVPMDMRSTTTILRTWPSVLALAAGVAGCAYEPPAHFIVIGNENAVSIQWEKSTLGSDGAQLAAEKHCARYGREAELSAQVGRFEVTYRCQ